MLNRYLLKTEILVRSNKNYGKNKKKQFNELSLLI